MNFNLFFLQKQTLSLIKNFKHNFPRKILQRITVYKWWKEFTIGNRVVSPIWDLCFVLGPGAYIIKFGFRPKERKGDNFD